MDVKLSNGDLAVTPSGELPAISGIEEAVQRVRIAAQTVKGSVVYDRELGTDYTGLSRNDTLLLEKLDMRIKESCADIGGVTVDAKLLSADAQRLLILVSDQNTKKMTEVDLSDYIQ